MYPVSHYVHAKGEGPSEFRRYERLLARTLRPFIGELRLTDAGVLIGYILLEREELLADLIESSAEPSLRPGFLHYGGAASAICEWGRKPSASIELEIRHSQLTAYFSLVFDVDYVGVNLHGVRYSRTPGTDEENWRRFAAVLADGNLAETGGTAPEATRTPNRPSQTTH